MTETKEQQECPYCHHDDDHYGALINQIDNDNAVLYIKGKNILHFETFRHPEPFSYVNEDIEINACPMCGRRL